MRKLQSIGIFNKEINGTLQWDDTDKWLLQALNCSSLFIAIQLRTEKKEEGGRDNKSPMNRY